MLGTLACLSSEIKKNNKRESDRRYIPHYIEKHDNIPLWVLVNSLTFGNISYFYSSLDESLKETIARSFGERFKKNYSSKDRFVSTDLSQVIKMANFFRNVCAHDEVLFTYKLRRPVKAKVFQKFFPNINFRGENLYDMICLLKLVLPKEEYLDLVSDIEMLFRKTEPYFKSVSFSKVIELSGFNDTWKSDIGL